MSRYISILFILISGFGANAQTSSEYLFQADKGNSYIGLEHSIHSDKLYENGGSQNALINKAFVVSYEYGVYEGLSAYGHLTFLESFGILPTKGMGPLRAGVKYAKELGTGLLFSKLNMSANVIDGKFECADGECNASDNSISLNLQLAYQWRLTNAHTGVSLDYGVFGTDIEQDSAPSAEKSGFFTITAFYERELNNNIWGTTLSYTHDGGLFGKRLFPPYAFDNVMMDESDGLKANAVALSAYLRTNLTDTSHLVTSLQYSKPITDDASDFSSRSHGTAVNFSIRKLL